MSHTPPPEPPDQPQGPGEGQEPFGMQPNVPQPVFDPNAPNQLKPKLRPVRGFATKHQEKVYLGISDAQQISDKVVFTVPAAQVILPMMDGQRSIDQIVEEVGRGLTRGMLEQLVAQLDEAGLIEGPKFDIMLAKLHEEFDSASHLPPGATAQFADALVAHEIGKDATSEQKAEQGPEKLKRQFDKWIDEALKDVQDPSFDELPRAIVAPHLDYGRGWLNYAHVYGRLRVVYKPDRIVILGTNHFGSGTGVCGCDKSMETPLGVSPLDTELFEKLKTALGPEDSEKLLKDRYDHEREHSVELHIAWVQHVFGKRENGGHIPIFAALVHDPSRNNGDSYDGQGLGLLPFVEAMKKALGELPGRTLIVSSADLSHAGPQFGDPKPLAGEGEEPEAIRNKIVQHDREMLELFASGKPEELVASMAWQQNPTRWCSVGNMVAACKIVEPADVRMLNYAATMDQKGMGMVSSCAAAIF